MDGILAPWHWAILIVVLLLVFGPKKLPELGSSLGKGIAGFKKGLKDVQEEVSNSMAEAEKQETVPVAATPASLPEPAVSQPLAESSIAAEVPVPSETSELK